MKNAKMNNLFLSHFCFSIFILKISGERVTLLPIYSEEERLLQAYYNLGYLFGVYNS